VARAAIMFLPDRLPNLDVAQSAHELLSDLVGVVSHVRKKSSVEAMRCGLVSPVEDVDDDKPSIFVFGCELEFLVVVSRIGTRA
jgi:hypothetical protein